MRKRLIIGMLAVALAAGGVGVGATAGNLTPTIGQLFGATTAGAASLNVEATAPLTPTGTGFSYQGRLKNGTNPARGPHDFEFTLYDASAGGSQVGGPVQATQTPSEGLFTVVLDFGATAFNGEARYLEIAVRPADVGGFVTLSPRQPITPAPYALYALKTKGYKNVVTVSPEGGDFTSVQAALNSITTNSSTNKYLIWIGPGTYAERVTMKEWVDIEGAGENVTKITFTGSTGPSASTVVGASNAELRSLTVENTGGSTYAVAIYNTGASPSLLHITATASGSTNNYGVYNITSSAPSMNNVVLTVSGGANNYSLSNNSSSPTVNNAILTASGGTSLNFCVYNVSSSPNISNMALTASGGSENFGVFNAFSSPIISNVKVTASGGSFGNYGLYNNNSSSPSINNGAVTVSGGTYSYGVLNDAASVSITNLTVTAAAGTNNIGVYNFGAGTHTINNSAITASTNTIVGSAQIGASRLSGGPTVGGPPTCAGVYDENYVFFPNTCP